MLPKNIVLCLCPCFISGYNSTHWIFALMFGILTHASVDETANYSLYTIFTSICTIFTKYKVQSTKWMPLNIIEKNTFRLGRHSKKIKINFYFNKINHDCLKIYSSPLRGAYSVRNFIKLNFFKEKFGSSAVLMQKRCSCWVYYKNRSCYALIHNVPLFLFGGVNVAYLKRYIERNLFCDCFCSAFYLFCLTISGMNYTRRTHA